MSILESLIQLDTYLFSLINSSHTPHLDFFFQSVTWLGSGWVITPILLGIIIRLTPRALLRTTIICGIIGISISGLVNAQIKRVIARPRPISYFSSKASEEQTNVFIQKKPPVAVRVLGPTLRTKSFPSGHSNTAFAAATFLILMYGGWFWCSYIAALLVAYSRIYIGAHFFIDTVGGALLGIAIMWAVWYIYLIRIKNNRRSTV